MFFFSGGAELWGIRRNGEMESSVAEIGGYG